MCIGKKAYIFLYQRVSSYTTAFYINDRNNDRKWETSFKI